MTTGGSVEILLEDALVDYITNWVADEQLMIKYPNSDPSEPDLETDRVELGSPAVHAGMLPRQETGIIDVNLIPVYPFVLAHIFKGHDAIPEGSVTTRIVVGVWDNNSNYQGYRDALRVLRKIVRKIWWENTLDQSFQMENESAWRIYDSNEVSWPYFMGEAIIGWRLRTPITNSESDSELEHPSIMDGSQSQSIIRDSSQTRHDYHL
jgi:hypothetical protein